MQNINPNTYVQYITTKGHIKVKEVERQVEALEVIYMLSGIQEEFFLLGLYDLNKRVLGVTFGNVQNLEMIAFLNSDFQSVEALPETAFLPANQELSIVKDTAVYDINFDVVPVVPPLVVLQKYQYDPFRYWIDLNAQNLEIEGVSFLLTSTSLIKEGVYTDIDGARVYQNDVFNINYDTILTNNLPVRSDGMLYFDFLGFKIFFDLTGKLELDSFGFDFLVDTKYNIFDLVTRLGSDSVVTYIGFSRTTHIWQVSENGVIITVGCVYRDAIPDFLGY